MNESEDGDGLLTVDEAADHLGIKPSTIYAYVSRGILNRKTRPGERRSYFSIGDLDAMRSPRRRHASPGPEQTAFRSSVSTIQDSDLYYRGLKAVDLAARHTFEEVADFLWTGNLEFGSQFRADTELVAALKRVNAVVPEDVHPGLRIRCFLPIAAALDPMRHDLQPVPVRGAVKRAMASMIEALPSQAPPDDGPLEVTRRVVPPGFLAQVLWSKLTSTPPTSELLRALNTTLVVVADHSASSHSTVVARLAAGRRASIYSVLGAALESGGGPVRASASLAIETYLKRMTDLPSVEGLLAERLGQGQELPGFGHRSYPTIDPRANAILDALVESGHMPERTERVQELLRMQERRGVAAPNIGFAIAMLVYIADMIPGSGELIFLTARAAGWTAHALEQYVSTDPIPQPDSIYSGPPPRSLDVAAPGSGS